MVKTAKVRVELGEIFLFFLTFVWYFTNLYQKSAQIAKVRVLRREIFAKKMEKERVGLYSDKILKGECLIR